MRRRAFIKGVGTAAGGVVALDQGVRRIRATETVSVAVYQTDKLTERFGEAGRDEETGQQLADEAVADVLEPHFSSAFEVERETRTVPHYVASLPSTLSSFGDGIGDARQSLANWVAYNRQRSDVDCHILLSYHPTIRTGNGIATPGVLPTCCEPIDRYGITWMAADEAHVSETAVRETIAHEIGHTIGLQHSHGTNIGGSLSVMLTSSYARRVGTNLFGERVYPAGGRVTQLNDEIGDHHLRV